MRRKGVSVLFILLLVGALAAQTGKTQPVTPVQLMAWLTSGISSDRLARLIQERGLTEVPGEDVGRQDAAREVQLHQFEAAGANHNLLRILSDVIPVVGGSAASEIPEALLKAAAEAKAENFHQADFDLRAAIGSDPRNAALHFALGNMLIRQERWDDAFDEITLSA